MQRVIDADREGKTSADWMAIALEQWRAENERRASLEVFPSPWAGIVGARASGLDEAAIQTPAQRPITES